MIKKLSSSVLLAFIVCFNAKSQSNLGIEPENMTNSNHSTMDVKENTFIDTRDNHQYKFISIGKTKWMAENLNFKTIKSLTYNNTEKNGDTLGRLYNWEEAKCACPNQWRLPTDEDWKALETSIGLSSNAIDSIGWRGGLLGNLLKDMSGNTWLNSININKPGAGFYAVAGGIAYNSNYFAYNSLGGYFWTATKYYSSFAWSRYLRYDKGEIFRNISAVTWYLSVRCVKDL